MPLVDVDRKNCCIANRNMRTCLLALVLLLFGQACSREMPEGYDTYGEAVPVESAVAVDAVIADHEAHVGEVVTTIGTVHAVCQMRGCWLTLKGMDDESIRVDVPRDEDDYVFTVPTDISGRRAVARGILVQDDADAAAMHHYNEDSEGALGPFRLSMVASGIMVAPR